MIKIGLTGQSGAGKSFICTLFRKQGIPCLDTDKVARDVTVKGSDCLNELVDAFGDGILESDGTLNRKKVAEIAFSDDEKYNLLNNITHNYILSECRAWLEAQEKDNSAVAVIDASLLIESGLNKEMDVVVFVITPLERRILRLKSRDNMDEESIRKRLSRQQDDEFYRINSDFTINNDDGIGLLKAEIDSLLENIMLKY